MRGAQVFRHVPGHPAEGDQRVWLDEDERNFLDITTTKDGRYLLLNSNSKTSSEVGTDRGRRAARCEAHGARGPSL